MIDAKTLNSIKYLIDDFLHNIEIHLKYNWNSFIYLYQGFKHVMFVKTGYFGQGTRGHPRRCEITAFKRI